MLLKNQKRKIHHAFHTQKIKKYYLQSVLKAYVVCILQKVLLAHY